jgi:hypothetical protein
MIMADVFAVFGTLLALGIALPGLLLTWQLLLPTLVTRAEQRLARTPWLCFFIGTGFLVAYLIPVTILFNLPWGGFKLMGFIAVLGLLAFTSLGAAGLATHMGQRLHHLGLNSSAAGATIRGAVALELAAAFPLIGWFIVIPLTFIVALGATLFALLGWMPRPNPRVVIPSNSQEFSAPI